MKIRRDIDPGSAQKAHGPEQTTQRETTRVDSKPTPPDSQELGAIEAPPVALDAQPSPRQVSAPPVSSGLWLTSIPEPTHVGAQWTPQRMGELKLNLGGEGEVKGFINVNPMMGNRRSVEQILQNDPTGAVLIAGAEALPYPDRSVREIRGNALPSPVIGQLGREIGQEIVRVLVPGGTAQISSNTPFARDVAQFLESLGFEMVGDRMARYVKPTG